VARPELGTKRTCPTTGRKFYDLNRDPIVSPYTGEAIPRTAFDPPTRATAAARSRAVEEEDEAEVVPAGAEVISLEDVEAGEEAKAGASDDDVAIEDEAVADDTFLEEEEGGDDVTALIDGDIEDEDEG
jgi:uncharacterized protein (TIGR02300 family)